MSFDLTNFSEVALALKHQNLEVEVWGLKPTLGPGGGIGFQRWGWDPTWLALSEGRRFGCDHNVSTLIACGPKFP